MKDGRISQRTGANFEPRFQSVSFSLKFQKSLRSLSIRVKVVSLRKQVWQVVQIETFTTHHLQDLISFECMLIFADHFVTKLIRRDISLYV
jgi:hypothetical protein